MTSRERQACGRALLASLAPPERDALLALFRETGRPLGDLAYSPLLLRMCTEWRNRTGREWVEPEMYYCLLAATRTGGRP